ncbi:hypothetical protein, conserved [Plasmodium gonderi]|uniref:Uncharacterized protein n=1 Tax=Plasmodium gonderi TaxID=77519 RepID=A0A1Y1JCN7_PLAGO|nr:hypothetical protein, conserved [Plasmodium gonderi]GAW78967.1 hypothetical protein, conserved [Plasmodium gonderi]
MSEPGKEVVNPGQSRRQSRRQSGRQSGRRSRSRERHIHFSVVRIIRTIAMMLLMRGGNSVKMRKNKGSYGYMVEAGRRNGRMNFEMKKFHDCFVQSCILKGKNEKGPRNQRNQRQQGKQRNLINLTNRTNQRNLISLTNRTNLTSQKSARKRKNNFPLYNFERSVDKVTGHFMKDKDLFIEVDKKQKMIEEIEKMSDLQYEHVQKYLDVLSENDVYEEIINHKIHLYKKGNEPEKQANLVKIQNFLNPHIISLRKKKAKEKVEYLIASLIKGENVDQIIMNMFQKKLIDIYVLTFIDDKIMEAHTKLLKNNQVERIDGSGDSSRDEINHRALDGNSTTGDSQISITERILRTLKDRIIAQQKLQVKGTFDFTRILFLSTTLDLSEDRQPIIKSVIKSLEQLEEFELYLLDALDYAEQNEKVKHYVPHLELLLRTCKKMNPIFNQLLNKQTENVRFFPDKVDLSQFREL